MFKPSAVPTRRSAILTVFRGATAINDGTTAEPVTVRNHDDYGGATAVYAIQASQWHHASGVMGVLAILQVVCQDLVIQSSSSTYTNLAILRIDHGH